MSLFSRLFRKPTVAAAAPAPVKTAAPTESRARSDQAARAQEEESNLSDAITRGDRAAVSKWVLSGSSTRIRQRAAQAISDPDQLGALIRATRGGNDKNVYRILTAKRDELLARTRSLQHTQAEVETAAAAIARHSERPHDALYAATLAQLDARWQKVAAHAPAELQLNVAAQLERAQLVLDSHRQALDAQASRKRAEAAAADEARRQRELETAAAAALTTEQATAAAAENEAKREAERTKREAADAEVRNLVGLLRQAQAALDHGASARAHRLREAIAEKLPQAPAALPPWFERNLQEFDARIAELKDWKTFTVVPKRAEMLQQMQSLIGADLAPDELARQIRHLRDDWRTLNRGVGDDFSEEMQQFDEAANRAYEPCKEYFAHQAELRKENQAQREVLLERLARFAEEQSGENANWRLVQQAISESRRDWQHYSPVDQSVARALQDRFHTVVRDLQSRLDAEYARNVQAKRDLIARATSLLGLADTRQAIDETKALQQGWKTVGIVPRSQDNALWEEFRLQCDAVFQRSSQEMAARGAALGANETQALSLCEQLERIAEMTGDELQVGAGPLNDLRNQFESLELPRSAARPIQTRFTRAMGRVNDALRRHRADEARRAWSALQAAAAHVRDYALAHALAKPQSEREARRLAAESAMASLVNAPKGTRAILEQRLAAVTEGTINTDLAANEAALRLLCVRAELIANIDSPTEDLPLRREYQMHRLVRSMERGERVTPAELDDLAREWLAVGPVAASTHDALLARFERCREAAG